MAKRSKRKAKSAAKRKPAKRKAVKRVAAKRKVSRKVAAAEYPNQSEPGKCELRITGAGLLYCFQKEECHGQCVLYSVPKGKPKAPWRPEKEQPATPDPKRYYFCRCLEL